MNKNLMAIFHRETDWWCPTCDSYISAEQVTFEEIHENCDTKLTDVQPTVLKQGDIVSILGNAEDKPQKEVKVIDVQYQPFSMLYHDRARKLCECLEGEDVFVNTPFVSLVEVLEKLNWDNDILFNKKTITSGKWLHSKNKNILTFWDKSKIMFQWILSDKFGEVPLHRQSQTTQDQIYEVLK